MSQARTSEVGVSTKGLKLYTILEILKVSLSGGFGDGAEVGDGATGVVGATGGDSRGDVMFSKAETGIEVG